MKKLIFILFFIPLIASGTNYYISSTDGSDSDSGLTSDLAWETITKVNSVSFAAGDSIFFKRGDSFVGTLTPKTSGTAGAYITFSAYGTGAKPIITPNDIISGGITWSAYGDGIYTTTDIGFNPGNIITSNGKKIMKIYDYWMTNAMTGGYYSNFTPLQLLALASDYQFSLSYRSLTVNVNFWDAWNGLYCYDAVSGTTYLRFKNSENPNDSTFFISANMSNAIYVNNKDYITLKNLRVEGGQFGIQLFGTASNIIIDSCYVINSDRKIYFNNGATYVTIRNNTITNNYLSAYTPGAYDFSTTTEAGIHYHFYLFAKFRLANGQSGDADQGIYSDYYQVSNVIINNNVVKDCINGITTPGTDCEVYDNYLENGSSVAIQCGEGSDGAEIHDNYVKNFDMGFRFQYVDETARTYYIYRNRIYNPDAGVFFYIHYGPTKGISITNAYFYHNSFIAKGGIDCSAWIVDNPDPSGFVFVNNIFSASGYNSSGEPAIYTKANCFVFYNNWIGGTFYGGSGTAAWATDASNIVQLGETFWDHSIDPPDFENTLEWEGEVIDAGIDISAPFTLGVVNYSALPGIDPSDYQDDPDIGYYEYGLPDAIVLTTLRPQWTSSTTALGGGNVVADGGTDVTERGVCWNTTGTPTTADDKVAHASGGVGSYIVTLTPLVRGTVYYVRAYAINSEGTSYGDEYRFQKLILHKGNKALFSSTGKILYID